MDKIVIKQLEETLDHTELNSWEILDNTVIKQLEETSDNIVIKQLEETSDNILIKQLGTFAKTELNNRENLGRRFNKQ